MNIRKLKAAMVEQGITTVELADQIGINRATLYRKIAAQGEGFTIGEAEAIARALHLNAADSTAIFLAHLSHVMRQLQKRRTNDQIRPAAFGAAGNAEHQS